MNYELKDEEKIIIRDIFKFNSCRDLDLFKIKELIKKYQMSEKLYNIIEFILLNKDNNLETTLNCGIKNDTIPLDRHAIKTMNRTKLEIWMSAFYDSDTITGKDVVEWFLSNILKGNANDNNSIFDLTNALMRHSSLSTGLFANKEELKKK